MTMMSDMLRLMADQLEGKTLNTSNVEELSKDKEKVLELIDKVIELDGDMADVIHSHLLNKHELNFELQEVKDIVNEYPGNYLGSIDVDKIVDHLSDIGVETKKLLDLIDKDDICSYMEEGEYWCTDNPDEIIKNIYKNNGYEEILDLIKKSDIESYMEDADYICAEHTSSVLEKVSKREGVSDSFNKFINNLDADTKGMLLAHIDLDDFGIISKQVFINNNFIKMANYIQEKHMTAMGCTTIKEL